MRGRIDGHAEEDWLQAEGEVAGSNEGKAVRPSSPKINVKSLVKLDGLDDHVAESDALITGGKQ